MELSRFEISSVFVGNMGFPTFFDKDFGLRYSDEGTYSRASYGFVAAFCDHLIGQVLLRSLTAYAKLTIRSCFSNSRQLAGHPVPATFPDLGRIL
jgi:hypothetical protein